MASMPAPTITAFDWVPDFAKGLVRDLRIRWAFEEIDMPYEAELFNAREPRPAEYLDRQPFDQVPAFRDGNLEFFESGAILLYLGEQDERLLPREPQSRWTAISWLFAGLNSVEPVILRIAAYDLSNRDKDWAAGAREAAIPLCERKLQRVNDALAGKDWLAGRFSIADIMMVTVLNGLRHTDLVAQQPALAAYHERATSRPTYQRALDAQLADFTE